MAEIDQFVTGGAEEKYECIWKLINFPLIQQTEQQLSDQQIEFEFGQPSTVWSKWIAGLKAGPTNNLEVRLQLVAHLQAVSNLSVKGVVEYSKTGGPQTFYEQLELSTPVPLGNSKEVTFDLSGAKWPVKTQPDVWISDCDDDGSLYLKIKLSVLATQPFVGVCEDSAFRTLTSSEVTKLQQSFGKLCKDNSFADLTIICSDGKELIAHQAILSARNPVFRTMLGAEMSEKLTSTLKIDDLSGATMQIILHFLYTGLLMPEWNEPEIIHQIVYAAGKYQLDELLNFLNKKLGTEDVPVCDMQLLGLASKLELKSAKRKLKAKLIKQANELSTYEELVNLFATKSLE